MFWGKDRKQRRVVAVVPVQIFGDLFFTNGHTINLSAGGCAIAGMTVPEKGQYLHLRLQVPKPHTPINIQLTVVAWSVPGLCGLEFIRLSATDQKSLQHYLCMLDLWPSLGTQGLPERSTEEPQPRQHEKELR
jgi:hypothetical protein